MKKKFWEFKNAVDGVGELLIYGDISDVSWWGDEITPKQFKEELDALGDVSQMNIYINSYGGDAFAGQAIYSMLKRHKASKATYIDGIAASIASVVAMAGDTIIMPKGSMMMIHNAWTFAAGNADELRKIADDLEKISDSVLLPAYARSGQSEEKIKELLAAETWLSAQDAVDLGFADVIEDAKQVAASISGTMLTVNKLAADIGRYKNFPVSLVTPGDKPPNTPSGEPPGDHIDAVREKELLLTIGLI